MSANSSMMRDANRQIIFQHGLVATNEITLSASGASVNIPIFTLTGAVEVLKIWGVVTTDLANHTAAAWRLNDQTAQVYITAVGGTSLTNIKAGSVIVKKGLVAAALTKLDNAAGVVSEPTTLETTYFSPFVIVKKTGALTQIEYSYTTSDTPTTGKIKFYVGFLPLSDDGDLQPV